MNPIRYQQGEHVKKLPQPSVIVSGPQGSGKTTNVERMKKFFSLGRVEDLETSSRIVSNFGTLYLTNRPVSDFEHLRTVPIFIFEIEAVLEAMDIADKAVQPKQQPHPESKPKNTKELKS